MTKRGSYKKKTKKALYKQRLGNVEMKLYLLSRHAEIEEASNERLAEWAQKASKIHQDYRVEITEIWSKLNGLLKEFPNDEEEKATQEKEAK